MNTSRNKDRWDSLSMKEKSDMMKAAVQQGIYNLSDIRKAYNEFAEGGPENNGNPRPITTGGAGYVPPAPTSTSFTFNPDRIVQDVPAREWGPTPISFDENGELNIGEQGEGNGGVADSMYYYLLQRGNKLGDKNIEIALNNLKNNPWYFNEKIPDEDISFAFSEKRPIFDKDNISKATTDQKKALAAHYIADSENYLNHAGAMRRYFGKDDLGVLRESAYKPGISKDPNSKYYIFNNMLAPGYWDPVVEDLVQSEEKSKHYYDLTLNEFTASKGHDNTGDYVSIYDIWDYNTNVVGRKNNSSPDNIKHVVNGKPFDIYHRVYLDDYYDVPNNKKGSYFLPEVTVTPDKKSLGGPLVELANKYEEGGDTNGSNIVDWIIGEEGFSSKPENIGDGKITLGSGLTASKWHSLYNQKGVWTQEDNRKAVAEEVENRRRWAEQNVPNWNELPTDSQNALLSYKYNYNFTRNNSPKLFKALEDRNYEEAARQMDATSRNPVFRKGLQARRQREQEMFMKGINSMNAPEPEVVEEIPQEESIYTPPQRVLDNMAAHNGRYMIMGNPPLAGVRNTVLDALRRLKALNLFVEGGPLVDLANRYY